jgi:Glycosyl hydrolases family 15
VALDRAVALADHLDASDRVEAWTQTQNQIHQAILTKGWSDRANAFTQSFGSDELDASSLMRPLVRFLPADDPRVLATINTIEERLTDDRGLMYRYRSHDSLEGDEGTFLLCTFWLAQALARAGHPARSRTVFERAAVFVNDIGLLAEEVNPVSGELLGNLPQAFSHIGLINAAWAISEIELREPPSTEMPPTPRIRRIELRLHRGRHQLPIEPQMHRLGSRPEATKAGPMTTAREISRCSLTDQPARITRKLSPAPGKRVVAGSTSSSTTLSVPSDTAMGAPSRPSGRRPD